MTGKQADCERGLAGAQRNYRRGEVANKIRKTFIGIPGTVAEELAIHQVTLANDERDVARRRSAQLSW